MGTVPHHRLATTPVQLSPAPRALRAGGTGWALVLAASVGLFSSAVASARAGLCENPEGRCTEPCPAQDSCADDADCLIGEVCAPLCSPSTCTCTAENIWDCSDDCAGQCRNAPRYTILDLGTLGGGSSTAHGINNQGIVVGGADTSAGWRHAFLWDSGVMIDLGTLPPFLQSEADEVNAVGQVVGLSTDFPGDDRAAFLWEDGVMIDLGHLADLIDTSANALNDAGQVVGISALSSSRQHAFLWKAGVMTDLGTLGGRVSIAWDVNRHTQVVGVSQTDGSPGGAFLWENDAMLNLGTLSGAGSRAVGISDASVIVGRAARSDGSISAFLWEKGQMSDLGALGGFDDFSEAEAINNLSQVIGVGLRDTTVCPFLYDPQKGFACLPDLIPADSGWSELSARDLNDNAEIVGVGTFEGWRRAFLMRPLPTGACCDQLNAECMDDVPAGGCTRKTEEFFEGEVCGEALCPPFTGACCDRLSGDCQDEVTFPECDCGQCLWTQDGTCEGPTAVLCNPAIGACCEAESGVLAPAATCQLTTLAGCDCPNCEWFKSEPCDAVLADGRCESNPFVVPAVSEWGMVITTLLFLIGGKVYFGWSAGRRGRTATLQLKPVDR